MRLRTLAVPVLVLVAGATACGGSSSAGTADAGPVQHPTALKGDVGAGDQFVISLQDQDGKPIKNLAAGSYTLQVNDESSIHNFHLSGGGVDDSTDVGGKGTKSFQVTFSPGTYTFVCDPHAGSMHGSFKVS